MIRSVPNVLPFSAILVNEPGTQSGARGLSGVPYCQPEEADLVLTTPVLPAHPHVETFISSIVPG